MGWVGLVQYRAKVQANIEQLVGVAVQGQKAQVAAALVNRLVQGSPVDTGEFRQGWHTSLDAPTLTNKRTADPLAEVVASTQNPKDWKSVLYIQNNVPHGPVLEYGLFDPPNPGPSKDPRPGRFGRILVQNGFSTQAPRGIIGDAVAAVAQQFGLPKL